jgi:hypothetical protein
MIVILSYSGVENVLNRSFITYKLPHSVRFRLAIEQNSGSCKALKLLLKIIYLKHFGEYYGFYK